VEGLTGACVDKDGLSKRGDDKRGGAASHVEKVDIEGLVGVVRLRHGQTTNGN